MSSNEPPSPRTWAMFTTGVALVSSAVTVVSVLGVQRLHRRRLRHDLEDDVRRSTSRREVSSSDFASRANRSAAPVDGEGTSNVSEKGHSDQPLAPKTPRYLAALNAQDSLSSPSNTPRPSIITSRQSTATSSSSSSMSAAAAASNLPRASTPTGPRHTLTPANRKLVQRAAEYDESLIREQLSRNYSFLGDDAMNALRQSFVIVVGAGGVGSWCALMLLRSGVGRLRLIDFDQVSLSSLNRHACATLPDVGRPKVQVCKERFAEIAPWCDVDARVEIFRGSEASRLLAPAKSDEFHGLGQTPPTFVVDCIDNLDTKVDLLAYCYHNKLPCFSSMGAGAKADPSQIQVADLNTTAEDPLARRVRRALRAKGVWGAGVMAKRRKAKKEGKGDENDERKREQEKALAKLESGSTLAPASRSAKSVKKLEHSGRGADDVRSNGGLSSGKRASLPQTPSISRRASSTSSAGSVYFSPASTPTDGENSCNDDGEKKDATVRGFHLPEADDFDKPSKSSYGSSRPPLATLQDPSSDEVNGSRRPSSLAELTAEEMRTASGGVRPSSGINLPTHVEEEEGEEVSHNEERAIVDRQEDEQASEKPFTIMCVYTNEKSDTRLLPLDEEEFKKGDVDELAALEDFRVRILPVLGPLPAMFGLAAATYIICEIAGRRLEPLPFKSRRKTAERMFTDLETSERRYPSPGSKMSSAEMALGPRRIPWLVEDIAYVFEEVYRCRSVVPPHETLSIGKLLRWDSTLPLSYSNIALFSRGQGAKHEEQVLKQGRSPVEVWGEEAFQMFKRRMAEERRMHNLR